MYNKLSTNKVFNSMNDYKFNLTIYVVKTFLWYFPHCRWSYQCQTCECLHGEVDCWELKCPPLVCHNPIHSPGDCCPHCRDFCSFGGNPTTLGNNCTLHNRLYPSGMQFVDPQDPCVTCKCQVSACFWFNIRTISSGLLIGVYFF